MNEKDLFRQTKYKRIFYKQIDIPRTSLRNSSA